MPSIAETVDAASITRVHPLHQAIQVDYNGGTNPTWVGWAQPGSLTSAAVWRIIFITWDGNNNPLTIQWACKSPALIGDNLYRHVWDDHASLTYT